MPSIIITARRTSSRRRLMSASVLARARDELAADRRLRGRACLGLNLGADRLARALQAPRGDAGELLLEHQSGERIAVGEVTVGRKRHLVAAVGCAHARALHGDAAA